MNKKDSLSDERLVSLHRRKRINAFFTLYNRYKNYGYAMIIRVFDQHELVNALGEEKDAILYEGIMQTINSFDAKRGSFRQLFTSVLTNHTLNRVREFSNDPLSDYVSLDASIKEGSNLRFADSLTFADKSATPPDLMNLSDHAKKVKKVVVHCQGLYKKRMNEMMLLKQRGYSYSEIARKFHMTEKAVRAAFYRLKHRIDSKDNISVKK